MRAETEIRDDLSVRPATIMEAATHQAEHGHIHCQCPARLWVEARDRLARDTGQLLDLHDQDMARVSEALNRAITERDHAREEWHRQNERADDYRRQLLDETYRPEGGEIVLRELRRTQRERDDARAKIAAIEPFLRDEAANDSPEAQRLLLMLAAVPETTGEQP